jgi:hypothetical protein
MSELSLPNFSAQELACRCCGLIKLAPGFGQALQGLRDALLVEFTRRYTAARAETLAPMHLSSACRCKQHNDRPASEGGAGGHYRSLHVGDQPAHPTGGCCSVDVRAKQGRADEYRELLSQIAWARGWSIGYHPRFLHLDLRSQHVPYLTQTRFDY